MKRYKEWIDSYSGDIYRKCKEVSEEMKEVFPELTIAKGLVKLFDNGKWYQHQWLVTLEGYIVDPTAKQWIGIDEYKEIIGKENEPVGRCCNCGEIVFGRFINLMFCSDSCSRSYFL